MDSAHSMSCDLAELISIQESKTYTNYANPILKVLLKAVKEKQLSSEAALLWIKFKMEANFRPDLSLQTTIRQEAEALGVSKNTAHKALKQLEEHGYIQITRRKQAMQCLPSMIHVRFPKAGIELAATEKDRKKPEQTIHNLSTRLSQKQTQLRPKNNDNIKNKYKQQTINNKPTKLSTSEDNHATDSSSKLQNRAEELSAKLDELNQAYKHAPQDLTLFNEKIKLENQLDSLKIHLHSKSQTKKTKAENTHNYAKKRTEPILLDKSLESYIERRVHQLATDKLVTNAEEQIAWTKYQLRHFEIGTSLKHGANAIIAMIKKNQYRQPKGYVHD